MAESELEVTLERVVDRVLTKRLDQMKEQIKQEVLKEITKAFTDELSDLKGEVFCLRNETILWKAALNILRDKILSTRTIRYKQWSIISTIEDAISSFLASGKKRKKILHRKF